MNGIQPAFQIDAFQLQTDQSGKQGSSQQMESEIQLKLDLKDLTCIAKLTCLSFLI